MSDKMHEEFEVWYASKKLCQACKWHPELNRYTVFSTKQFAWEVWNASRGIDYVFNHGFKQNSSSSEVEQEPIQGEGPNAVG